MIKITKEENDRMEAELEGYHAKMNEIEKKLDQIEAGEYDADKGEIEAIKARLEDEYKSLESDAHTTVSTLNRSFVSEKWEDDAGFDYQLTEMKA